MLTASSLIIAFFGFIISFQHLLHIKGGISILQRCEYFDSSRRYRCHNIRFFHTDETSRMKFTYAVAVHDIGFKCSYTHYRYRSLNPFIQCRSEEHTSELQSRENLVCRLLLEKKKKNKK